MRIGGLQKTTLNDFPGKIACSIFLHGCNFRCGYCHNPELVLADYKEQYTEQYVLDFIDSRRKYLNGVCISGGEPTLHPDLKYFLEKLKKRGLAVKLDTNGSAPIVLQELKEKGLVDCVAMDVKGPDYLYPAIIGRKDLDLRKVEEGMVVTTQFLDYKFRTTVGPVRRADGRISFMTIGEIVDTAKWIVETTGSNKHKYVLQPFVPHEGELIDPKFGESPETPRELLEEMCEEVKRYLPNCYNRQ